MVNLDPAAEAFEYEVAFDIRGNSCYRVLLCTRRLPLIRFLFRLVLTNVHPEKCRANSMAVGRCILVATLQRVSPSLRHGSET